MSWDQRIRDLWVDFLFWIRYYIRNLVFSPRGPRYLAPRLLRNADEFADAFMPFYGEESARRFRELLTQHVLLLSEFAATVRAGEDTEAQRAAWYANADEIAGFFASVNPYWDEGVWRRLLYQRFSLEEALLLRLQEGDFMGAIEQFDVAQLNAEQIANYMIDGIAMQFQLPTVPQ